MSEHAAERTGGSRGPRRATRLVAATALLLAVAATATGALVATAGHRAGASADPPGAPVRCGSGLPTVTETATGTVSVTPNLLTLALDVHATAPSAQGALGADDATTAAVIGALRRSGVAAADVQTTDLTIQPSYTATGTLVSGYAVDDAVVAKLRSLAHAGTVIDAAVAAGGSATRIESVTLSLTPPLHAQDRARHLAVLLAVGHAKAMAAAAGRHVTGICSIKDSGSTGTTGPRPPFDGFTVAGSATARVPVQAGSQGITSRVTVVFALG